MSDRAHQFLLGLLGLACLIGGAVLTIRPFTTLSVLVVLVAIDLALTGAGDIAMAGRTERPWSRRASGLLLLVVAAAALSWPDATLRAIALLVGIGMIVGGVGELGQGGRGDEGQVLALIRGLASIVLGVLALAWPGLTLLVVAVLFGIRTMVYGCDLLAHALVRRVPQPEDMAPPERRGYAGRFAGGLLLGAAFGASMALAVASIVLHDP